MATLYQHRPPMHAMSKLTNSGCPTQGQVSYVLHNVIVCVLHKRIYFAFALKPMDVAFPTVFILFSYQRFSQMHIDPLTGEV